MIVESYAFAVVYKNKSLKAEIIDGILIYFLQSELRRKINLMSDFWVGNFKVDVSRSQITFKGDIISLEPRVLNVLLTLAKNQGQVVTHEVLLESVWPNVVVAPNAVQRCIGQLRKALGDDAKQQKMISTHPKVGYCLIAKVQWSETNVSVSVAPAANQSKKVWLVFTLVATLLLITLVGYFFPTTTPPPINRLTPITSTDEKEYYPSFSPDGRFIVYNRYISICENELWAKDLTENREYLLTKNSGFYGPATWSPDGNQLAFSKTGGCQSTQPEQTCRNISAISFILAKSAPQTPRVLLACEQHSFGGIQWLTNEKIAFIDAYARHAEVKSVALNTGTVDLLYRSEIYQPRAISYSARNKKIAITVHDEIQNSSLILLNTQDNTTEHVSLKVPSDYSDYLWWDLNWHPHKDILITSAETSLFEIDLSGRFIEYPITSVSDIYNPMYHPDGDKIIAVIGDVDLDIEEYRLVNKGLTAQHKTQIFAQERKTIYHSTVEDYQAKYQPTTLNISFISGRSGEQQIWFSQDEQLKQLSHFGRNTRISSYVWSLDGLSMALAIKGKLQVLTLDGQTKLIATPFKIIDVYQWINKHEVLLSIIKEVPDDSKTKQREVVRFNLNTGKYIGIYQGFSHWAQLDDQSLYYTNWSKVLHRYENQQSNIITATQGMSVLPGFIIKQQQLALFSQDNAWLYSFDEQALTKITTAPSPKRKANLSDIDFTNNRLLFSIYQSTRKNLVLFHQ